MSEELLITVFGKINKLEKEIHNECEVYAKNTLENNKGYKYYSAEIDTINTRRDRDIEALERQFEAQQKQFDAKRQAIIDKAAALSEQYLNKCSDIEQNHKRPTSMAFRKKEQELSTLEKERDKLIIKCDEEMKKRAIIRQADEKLKEFEREKKEKLEKAEALEAYYAGVERARLADEKRWANQAEKPNNLNISVPTSFGVPSVIKFSPVRKPLGNRNINELSRDEIDELDQSALTPEEYELLMDRMEYLDNNKEESKELSKEFLSEKKKERKEAKKNSKLGKPSG
jgi:hypothetical protein